MAITQFTDDVNIIQDLSNLPNASDGLTAPQFKAKFDEAPNMIKTYINTVLIAALEATAAGASGAHNIGSAPITGVAGSTVYAQLAALKAFVDAMVITTIKIGDNAVTTAKIANLNVSTAKLADLAVTAAKIANGTITLEKIDLASLDSRYYTETEIDNMLELKADLTEVYTREELTPFLQGGDTSIKYEVYSIVSSDNGDGTFTYQDIYGVNIQGTLSPEGHQIFTLQNGVYAVDQNRIELIINDTLQRSKASGGLAELTTTTVALTVPEGAGAEITIKYYERISLTGQHSVVIGETTPINTDTNLLWFKLVG